MDLVETNLEFDRDQPPEYCGGGQPFDGCEISQSRLAESLYYTSDRSNFAYEIYSVPTFLAKECGNCALICSVAVQLLGRQKTGRVRLSYKSAETT